MSNNYIFCKIFVLLFFSFLSVSCGINNVNTKTASTTNNNIVITSPERVVNIKEGETFRFVVKLNRASTTDITFDWSVQHISTSAEDFTGALTGSQLIRAGDTTTTISIDTSDDSVYETDETFSLNITNVTGAAPSSLVARSRIIDNDPQPSIALLRFEQVDSTTTEGASFTYKLELTKVSATNVSFDWSVQHISTSAEDFTGALTGSQLIRAGDTTTTISIDTSDDSVYETDETFSLNITNVTGAAPSSLVARSRIIDNDPQPSIALLRFEQVDSTTTEGASFTYKLELTKVSATNVSFDWSVQHISTSAEDFTGALTGSQLIRAGDTTTTISIDTSDDSVYETDETFSLNITNVTGAAPSSLVARSRIIDNDPQPSIALLRFEQVDSTTTEGASFTYKLELTKVSATNVSFDWSVQHISTSAEDFTGALTGTQLIRAGDTTTTISIDTSDDSVYETDETFSLNITNVTGAAPSSLVARGRIIDNDPQPSIALLRFEQVDSTTTEGASFTYKLELTKVSATNVSFDWSVQHISTSAEDFTGALTGTQLIRAGDTTTTISIDTSDDSVYETDETFSLNITKVTGATPSSLTASGRIIDNDPQPSMSLLRFEQVDSTTTEGASFTYKLELTKVSATNVSFDWSVQHISTSAEDFTGALTGSQLIRAGDTTATISIDTSDDSVYETDETFSLNITKVTGAAPSSLVARGRIIDNDPQPSMSLLRFEQVDSTTTEGASFTYKLELTKVSATNVSFDWSVQHISTSAEDFTGALTGTQLIRAGDTTTTISIDTSDDSVYETDETFSLNITKVTGATPSSLTASGRIIDNDPQPSMSLLRFEQVDSTTTEGASLNYRLELNRASTTNVSFDWSVQHISTSAEDFTGALTGTQLIRAGDTTTTISIDTSDDSVYETDETFSLNITKVTGAAPSSLVARGRIIDNDPQPSIALLRFEQVDSTTTEGASFNYRLELNRASTTDITFDWSVQHISTSAEDFTGALTGTQLIRAGDTTTTISIDTSDDSVYETDETFSLNITKVTGATPSSLVASGRIIDNDPQPSIALLRFEQVDSTTTEGASLNYRLELNRASTTDITFDWSVQHISTSAEDFTGALTGTQLIRAGDTTATISIDTSDDSVYETDETFSLNITKVTGTAPSSLVARGRIIDNNPQPSMSLLRFEQVDSTTTEGASLNYKLELNRASTTDITFDWSVQHISTSAEDFTGALTGSQLIRAGDTTATISIDTSDDSVYETDETFSLNITKVTGAAPSSLVARGRIIDNDPQPSIALLSFEQVDSTTTEGASLNYRLELNRASTTDITFDWSVQHISTSAEDFTGALTGSQLIRAGDTTTTISIDTSDDSVYETDETFSLNITNVIGAAPSSLVARGRIIDNDPQPSMSLLRFEQVDSTTTEGASLNYRLQLNRASTTDITFDWSVQHISTSAEDFTGALTGSQLIRAGDTTTTISIDTSDDSVYETDETFSLNITKVTGATPSSLTASGRIIDNDPQPSMSLLRFEQVDSTTTEGASLNYRLQLNRASTTDITFDWYVQHISTSAEDFTGALTGTQLIRAGDTTTTISIDTSDDSVYETDETFSLNITKVTGATPSSLTASGRIIDNDPQSSLVLLSFEQNYLAATEDASLNYRLQISKASTTNVSFDWYVQHISTSAEDFTGALTGTQLIRAGDTTTTISIDTSDDSVYETDETFSLNITKVTGATPSSLTASGRIIDNDPQPSMSLLRFKQVDSTTTEGASLNYRLELNRASTTDITFDWSVQHISTSAEDFTGALTGSQLIRAGDTTTTISIDTSDDSVYETDETFSLNITKVTGAAPSSLVARGRIIDNDPQPSMSLLRFEQVDSTTTEGASLNYRLQLNRASTTDITFDWSVQHISTSAEDFTGALTGTQLIRAGDTTTTISIDTSDDSVYETDETFSLNITKVTGAAPSSLVARGRIIDNDPQPSIALLRFEQVDSTTTEGASLNYRLELNRASTTDITFDWSVQHISTSAEDFTGALTGSQLIRAGDTTTTISIDTSDDSVYETDETFSLNITKVTGAAPSSLVARGRIIDNDPQSSLVLLSFEQNYLAATEDASLNYRLQISKASTTNVSFDWYVQHISTSAEDFTGALTGTQLIRAGDTTTTISIDTSDDSVYETDETFSLNITKVTGATPSSLTASGRIIDNDPQPSMSLLRFKQVDSTTTEGASLNYRLELNRASTTDITFDWSVQHISTSAEDFTGALTGSQLIRAGDTTTTISIDTSDDSVYETDETFSLNITKVTGAAPSSLVARGRIIDNDPQPSMSLLRFEQVDSTTTEGASLNYRLELNRASTTDITFDWSVQHISTSAEDFTGALTGTQLIRAGDTTTTISIDTSDDSVYETDETFSLNITKVTGAAPSSLVARGRIIDNDPQPSMSLLRFEQVDSTTTEGASLNYRLELNRASTTDITFDWSVQHISTSAEDFTGALTGSQLIRAGDTTTTISIDTSDDSVYETDETFSLNITKVTGAAPSSLVARGRIIDNDPQPSITFERDYSSVTEGDSLSYTLQLNKVSTLDVSFDWYLQHSSTIAEDFTGALAGTKKIIAGSTTTDIVIDTSDDTLYEGDEEFMLNITNITGAVPNRLVASGRITNNDPQPTIFFEQVDTTTTEGDSLSYTLQLNKVSALDVSFDWYVQHSSTIAEDFRGALAGTKKIIAGSTTTDIVIDTSDDLRPELAEDFTLHITNIRGATPDSLSTLITIAASDIGVSVDYNGNGLIDIVTQEHFDNIRHNLAGTSYKTSASDAGVKCGGSDCRGYELLANLDLSMFTNWQPIGSTSDPFTSILQGNGYSIANLAIDGGDYLGLFATLSGATIDNLVVEVASISGDSYVGALAGRVEQSAISRVQVRAVNASSKLQARGEKVGGMLGAITGTTIINVTSDLSIVGGNTDNVGGIVGYVSNSAISYAISSGSVFTSGRAVFVGGLAGYILNNSAISYSSASGSVSSNGHGNNYYGGLVGVVDNNSAISYSSASGSVSSNGHINEYYGGLVGYVNYSSTISYSSASGSVSSSGNVNKYYGGLVGFVSRQSAVSYSSASGSVISNINFVSNYYGGLVGVAFGEVRHSWSSSSVFANNPAGLIGQSGSLKFSYAIGYTSYGLVATNVGTITNSYWNSETSGALKATDATDNIINIASSDTAGMLASTGSAGARIFKGFFDATDEHNRKIWTFTSGSYPAITELGVDKQAVSLAYGLLRLASPYASTNTLDSFLGATLNNENIELIANSYSANDTLAILDINLLQSNSATCAAGSGKTIMTTTGANGTTIVLQKIAGNIEIEKSPSNSCEIIFSNQKTDGTLQLAAIISKGATSLTKKFEITLNTIQSIIVLHPTKASASEGDELVFTLELNHRASRDLSFAWYLQHSSTSTSDFTGAIFGSKTILAKDTDATIVLQINDDNLLESVENFTLSITNITGAVPDSLSASITILASDVDNNGNGLIDLSTQENLDNIRYNLAGTSYKTSASDAGTNCGGSACRGYELLGDLDLSSFANWQPIGSHNNPFTGILQGNGYSIANLVIDGGNFATDDRDYLGLFSALSGATIDNLVVEVASISGDSYVGALAGRAEQSAISRVQVRAVNASSKLQARGEKVGGMLGEITDTTITNVTSDLSIVGGGNKDDVDYVGGIVGYVLSSTISYAYSSGSVSAGSGADNVGGLVGELSSSTIDYSSTSGEVTNNGGNNSAYGGLVGFLRASTIRYSSASGSVTSNGINSNDYGGLVGYAFSFRSKIRYSSASGSVTSNGDNSDNYGGLVGNVVFAPTISYSSASGSVTSNGSHSDDYGGLVGKISFGTVMHSWSSSSVFAYNSAGLIGQSGSLKFSYAIGYTSYGLVATNVGTIANSYWNSETSGALEAASANVVGTNIASSDTAGMLASTGSAGASVFADFADATDKHNRNIWTFASGHYPVITEIGVDKQAVALAYGLLRLASPYASTNTLGSFLGATLNNEDIELTANSYNANDTLAILDVNLLAINSTTCAAGSGDTIMTTTGANGTTIALQKIAGSIEIEKSPSNSCEIIFSNQKTDGTLQLAAIISKGAASLTKKFEITLKNIQSRIALQPTKASASEGDELVFTLELNHRARRALSFAWYLQHSSTSVEDFRGATFGDKILFAGDTTTAIRLQINDDDRPENAEDFTFNITNIRGITHNNLSASITILENDIDITLDYDGNGLIDIITQERLGNIRHNLAGTSYKTSASDAGTNCGGSACRGYELLGDLDLSSFANWQPIGSQNDPFTSILQGNGYSIANLVIDGGDYLGLFAALSGATIDNLVVEVVSISGDSDVGALAGRAENSAISRVQIRAASASSKLSATGARIGGILGRITDTTITNATSDLDVVEIGGVSLADLGGAGLGGIVGYAEDSSISHAYSSASISAGNVFHSAGGLVGYITNSSLSYSSASGSVSGSGTNENHGGLVGYMESSSVSYSSASGSVISSGRFGQNHGGLVGYMTNSNVSYSSASGSVSSSGNTNYNYGGLAGYVLSSTISYAYSSGSVSAGSGADNVGGLVGELSSSTIDYSSTSGEVTSSGADSDRYGGLVGYVNHSSTISYSSASGSVSSNGNANEDYGGLVGYVNHSSTISYSSASGSVSSNGNANNYYGGLVGVVSRQSAVSYSSASGSVISNINFVSNYYGGLVGVAFGEVRHSWSSSSVFASSAGGLVGFSSAHIGFSYALGVASYGLVAANSEIITDSYWNSETSGALKATDATDNIINIASSDTAGMLASTGSAGARIFKGFFDATDEHNRNIWSFASGSYPIITEIGVDKQAVSLAYGLLRLASPYAGVSNLDSFLGATLNNEDIELTANSYNANDTLAILDVNLLAINSTTCAAGSGDTIMTTTGANGTTIALQKIAGNIEIEKSPSNSCEIIFSNQKTDGTLQLAAIISKGATSLTKKFEITLQNIQPIISLQPTTLSTSEGDELVFTLELNHRALRDISFAWSVQHSSTSTSDFTGAISGFKTIPFRDTTATIELRINDDNLPESAETFTLSITNITGAVPDSSSASITILASDVDNNGNGLIDIVTQEHFDNIRHNLAGTSYKTSASDAGVNCGGSDCRGYELFSNLDLSSFANWQPIGSTSDPFTSILQGNGYSIANLAINGGNNIGLFATLSGATIDNLVVEVVSISGDSYVGALAGRAEQSTISRVQIRAASASSTLLATGANIGGMLGETIGTTITNVTSDLSIVGGNTENADNVGGIVGYVSSSDISYATSSGSVFASGGADFVGGLVGQAQYNSKISYSSSSGSVSSSGNYNEYYGGLVGNLMNSALSYSSASGNVSSNGTNNLYYGGLSGASDRSIRHSWSSGSVFAVNLTASLVSLNRGYVDFSYAIGAALYGLVGFNIDGTITNSYWNSETSGVLAAANHLGISANIASSDTADMLYSTGSAGARIFKGFFDATDELGDNIWSFANGSYPVITKLGIDEQAVALAYGLLRLAHPTITSGVSSFLGGTLHNEAIALDVVDYSAASTLAILDVNLLQSSSAICSVGSGGSIITTTGANQAVVTLSVTSATNNLHERIVYTGCNIGFDSAAVIQAGDRLQLAVTITKGSASLTKKFIINFR